MAELKRILEENMIFIQKRLPTIFYIAESEVRSLSGKLGPEIGLLREKILISMLRILTKENTKPNINPMTSEVDAEVFNKPLSIKTSKNTSNIKIFWTADQLSAERFVENFKPTMDILFVHIAWGKNKNLYLIPLSVQEETFDIVGKEFLKAPKPGTNSRGVCFNPKIFKKLLDHCETTRIPIFWSEPEIKCDSYERWVKLFNSD